MPFRNRFGSENVISPMIGTHLQSPRNWRSPSSQTRTPRQTTCVFWRLLSFLEFGRKRTGKMSFIRKTTYRRIVGHMPNVKKLLIKIIFSKIFIINTLYIILYISPECYTLSMSCTFSLNSISSPQSQFEPFPPIPPLQYLHPNHMRLSGVPSQEWRQAS